MNPRQRRGVVMLVLAALGACVVFIGVASYVAQVNAEVGPRTTVYVASKEIPAFTAITPDLVQEKSIPAKYVVDTSVTKESDFLGQKSSAAIEAGSYLSRDMLTPSSSLDDGMREISINFDAQDGINGRVRPGDRVDVIAAFAARQSTDNQADQSIRKAELPFNVAGVVVSQALVVSVGSRTTTGIDVGGAAEGNVDPAQVVPVTFALSVADATRLAYAEAFSVKMRIMRSGNNESGNAYNSDDLSFSDQELPGLLKDKPKGDKAKARTQQASDSTREADK